MLKDDLQQSINHYRRILDHAQQLEILLAKGDADGLASHTARLNELQEDASRHDRDILPELTHDIARWQAHPLYQERMQLLEEIVEMNNLLLPKIRGMMSVSAAELAQIKGGRVAVAGYHPSSKKARGISRGIG